MLEISSCLVLARRPRETVCLLEKMYNQIMKDKVIPWKTSWTIPIYKKGAKNSVCSYRGINLSSCIEKLFTKVINKRICTWMSKNRIIHPNQTGFIKGNSVIDNILMIREIIQIYKNKKTPLYTCFIDLSKAFDSIPQNYWLKKCVKFFLIAIYYFY